MVQADFSAPSRLAWQLGLSGLLPFVGLALLLTPIGPPSWRASAGLGLVGYGALISSFLGGIYWGLAMRRGHSSELLWVWGVVPSLLAWPAFFMPTGLGLVLLAGVLCACFAVDRQVYPAEGLQSWLGLRATLTAGSVASCLAGAWTAW